MSLLRAKPQRYVCPQCKWDFALRKKRHCPGCGTLLLIGSDVLDDTELITLKSFWMWEPVKEKWIFVRDWEEHKREAMRKFEEHARSYGASALEIGEVRRPLRKWLH